MGDWLRFGDWLFFSVDLFFPLVRGFFNVALFWTGFGDPFSSQ